MKSVLKTIVLALTVVVVSSISVAQAANSVVAEDKQCCNRTSRGCDCYSGSDGDCSACREENGSGTSAPTTGKSDAGSGSTNIDKGGSSGGKKIDKK